MSNPTLNLRVIEGGKEAQPKCVGTRGSDNEGVIVIFDRPVALELDQEETPFWKIPWITLGRALLLLPEADAKSSHLRNLCLCHESFECPGVK